MKFASNPSTFFVATVTFASLGSITKEAKAAGILARFYEGSFLAVTKDKVQERFQNQNHTYSKSARFASNSLNFSFQSQNFAS